MISSNEYQLMIFLHVERKEIANSSSNGHGQAYSQSSSAKKHMVLGSLSLVEDKIWGLPSQNIWNHDHVQSAELLEHHVDQVSGFSFF